MMGDVEVVVIKPHGATGIKGDRGKPLAKSGRLVQPGINVSPNRVEPKVADLIPQGRRLKKAHRPDLKLSLRIADEEQRCVLGAERLVAHETSAPLEVLLPATVSLGLAAVRPATSSMNSTTQSVRRGRKAQLHRRTRTFQAGVGQLVHQVDRIAERVDQIVAVGQHQRGRFEA